MGNPQDHITETNFSKWFLNRGNEYSKKNNYKLAIASYSWAIAFNNDILDPSMHHSHVFEYIWVATNAGGTQKSIDYSNAGLKSAIHGNWEEALNNFLLAIDTDLLFAETFASKDYHLVNHKIKSVLRDDISKIKISNKQYTLSLGNCIYSFPDEYRNCVKPQRLNNGIDDNFFLSLQDFCESNGREVFIEKCFYGVFSDYMNGEHKKDMLLLKKIVNLDIMEIINKLTKFECDGKNDLYRMVDIIYYLLTLQIKENKE